MLNSFSPTTKKHEMEVTMHKKTKRILAVAFALALCLSLQVTAFAEGSGDVASAVQSTWTAASGQIKTVTNNVIFPALDMILAIFFFVKLGAAYFDYRQGNRFDWAPPAILFVCLVFTLTAPTYIWTIIGA